MHYEIVFKNGSMWEKVAKFLNKSDAEESLKKFKKEEAKRDFFIDSYKIRRAKSSKRSNMRFEIVFEGDDSSGWEKIAECEGKEDGRMIIKAAKKIDKKDRTNGLKYKIRKIKKSKK